MKAGRAKQNLFIVESSILITGYFGSSTKVIAGLLLFLR
jgi:hypothetical protein